MRVTIAYDAVTTIISTDIFEYAINLSSTPLNSNDSTGSVGDFTVAFHLPYDENSDLNERGIETLEGKEVQFTTEYGTMYGIVRTVTGTDKYSVSLECTSYAGGLNAYNVRATPQQSYLGLVLPDYFALGSLSVNVDMESDLYTRPVAYPGWSGELWHHLKLLCAAENIQMVLTGQGYVYVEKVRQVELPLHRATSLVTTTDSSNLAQFVEVMEYNCRPTTMGLFYPPGGWSEDVEILSVSAGEYTEQTIELGGSMSYFHEPIMKTFVGQTDVSDSAYTIVAEDGFPIKPAQWADSGGHISFEVGEDFRTVIVKMRGANGIRLDDGELATSFSLALSADTGGGSRYSTLRLTGEGVLHDYEPFQVATGVPEAVTGTEVGVTIDNPFLYDRDRVGAAASRAVREFSGAVLTAQGQATNLGVGFGEGDTGARVRIEGRPFRVRDTNYTPDGVSLTFEDDLVHSDVEEVFAGKTYQQIENQNDNLTYRNVFSRGLRYGNL